MPEVQCARFLDQGRDGDVLVLNVVTNDPQKIKAERSFGRLDKPLRKKVCHLTK